MIGGQRLNRAHPDRIVVCDGFAAGLALLTGVLRARGATTLAVEEYGLPSARDTATAAGLRLAPLPVDGDGAVVEQAGQAGAVLVTPAHQFPLGAALAARRRTQLVEWARDTGGLVIEDDYDGEFRYDRQPVGALQGMAPGHVAYVGSASKTLGPALRLAWMVLPEHLVGPVAEEKKHDDFQTGVLGQLTLAEFIASHGYDKHIRAARLRYRRRRDLLISRITHAAGIPDVTVRGVAAGLQTLIDLPPGGPSEADVLAVAGQHGVALETLGPHWHAAGRLSGQTSEPGDHPQGLLIGFASATERAYPVAVEALIRVLRAVG